MDDTLSMTSIASTTEAAFSNLSDQVLNELQAVLSQTFQCLGPGCSIAHYRWFFFGLARDHGFRITEKADELAWGDPKLLKLPPQTFLVNAEYEIIFADAECREVDRRRWLKSGLPWRTRAVAICSEEGLQLLPLALSQYSEQSQLVAVTS